MVSDIIELLGPGDLRTRTEQLDTDCLRGREIAARTICSVISPGTEKAAYRGDPPLRPMRAYPRVLGYCNLAEIVACAAEVKSVRPGDRILTGQSHRSAFICTEDKILAKVPPGVDPMAAAATYLFQLGLSALCKCGLAEGHNVAVVGLGVLGLGAAALSNHFGASVYAFSDRLLAADISSKFGVHRIFGKSDGEARDIIGEETGRPVDLVISTSNSWQDWRLALSLPRAEGTIGVLGFPGRAAGPPDFNPLASEFFYDRQLRIVACGMTPQTPGWRGIGDTLQDHCRYVLDLIITGVLPASELISAVVPWQKAGTVYERLLNNEPGLMTAALQWS